MKGKAIMSFQNTMKALSDPVRRKILEMLKTGSMPAGDIAESFPISSAAISKHLSILKDADLVIDRRDGKYIYYQLNASVLEEVMLWLVSLKGGKDD